VRVEVIATQIGKVGHVSIGDRTFRGHQRLTDLEIVEVFPERMGVGRFLPRAGHVLVEDARQRRW